MKQLFSLILLILLIPFVYSIEYYVDERITIEENGDASIKGTTNIDILADIHPIDEEINGITSELTAKKGKYWLFSYDSKRNLSASFIKINLPRGAVINYIKSQLSVNIATNNNIITATFSGENAFADIKIQYSLDSKDSQGLNIISWLIILLTVISGILLFVFLSRKKLNINTKKLSTIKPTLNETQIKIIDALLEKRGQASQTTIQYMTGIPKASLSRNVELLAQKEIIQKFYNGTSNHLKIHPSLKK